MTMGAWGVRTTRVWLRLDLWKGRHGTWASSDDGGTGLAKYTLRQRATYLIPNIMMTAETALLRREIVALRIETSSSLVHRMRGARGQTFTGARCERHTSIPTLYAAAKETSCGSSHSSSTFRRTWLGHHKSHNAQVLNEQKRAP